MKAHDFAAVFGDRRGTPADAAPGTEQAAITRMLDFEPVDTGRIRVHTVDLSTGRCPSAGALLRCDGHVLAFAEDTTSGDLALYFSPDHPPAEPYAAGLLRVLREQASARGYTEETMHITTLDSVGTQAWAQ